MNKTHFRPPFMSKQYFLGLQLILYQVPLGPGLQKKLVRAGGKKKAASCYKNIMPCLTFQGLRLDRLYETIRREEGWAHKYRGVAL